ncbi:MAG: hypothetical protein WCT47_22545, partial [Betaproteobacteria bacterium]
MQALAAKAGFELVNVGTEGMLALMREKSCTQGWFRQPWAGCSLVAGRRCEVAGQQEQQSHEEGPVHATEQDQQQAERCTAVGDFAAEPDAAAAAVGDDSVVGDHQHRQQGAQAIDQGQPDGWRTRDQRRPSIRPNGGTRSRIWWWVTGCMACCGRRRSRSELHALGQRTVDHQVGA